MLVCEFGTAALHCLGQAEVQNLHMTIAGDEDVVGLQVAMRDVLLVRCSQAVCNLNRVIDRLAMRQDAAPQDIAQSFAFQQLRNQILSFAMLADVEDRQDVGMIQRSDRPRFLLETPQAFRISGKGSGQDLDRDLATEASVARAIHLSHATSTESGKNFVGPEFGSRGKRHRRRNYRGTCIGKTARQPSRMIYFPQPISSFGVSQCDRA